MSKQNIEQLYRTSLVLWSTFVLSQSMLLMVLYFTKPDLFKFDFSQPFLGDNFVVVAIFGFMAIFNVFISIFLKVQAIDRAIEEQQPKLLQQGLILGCAFCESLTILGMVLAFGFNYQYFFIWFIFGVLGMLIHFPRRENFHKAGFNKKAV
jgi:F0F1-type ATP synthase membrane subunit c/vacuolar-type H+-ATPase subunit K